MIRTALLLAAAATAHAAAIRPLGVLGNSGLAGEGLVRVGAMPLDGCASGVALDSDGALWMSGGDAINRIGPDGHLIERFPIEPAGSIVDSRTFAVLDRTLYFVARTAKKQVKLFALPMAGGSHAEAVGIELPVLRHHHSGHRLAPQPLDGRLLMAADPKDAPDHTVVVYRIDPQAPSMEKAFTLTGDYPQGIAVDAKRRRIYLGASFGLFVGGITHSNVYAITAVDEKGSRVSDAFPAACPKTPATPTQFRGGISLAGGGLWDTAWYGFLARLDDEGRGAPGRIVAWHNELDHPTQVLGVRDAESGPAPAGDPLLIATPMPDACYFCVWSDAERKLRFVRRIGSLPVISSLGLSPDGWVTAGTARTQLWWRWADGADAPPTRCDIHLAITPLFFRGEDALAVAAQYHLRNLGRRPTMPTIFNRRPGNRNEALRVGKGMPVKRAVGLAVQATPGKPVASLFVTGEGDKRIWRTDLWVGNLRPDESKWAPVAVDPPLVAPTDIVALLDGRLLVADEKRLVLLKPQDKGYKMAWELRGWGDGPDQAFGSRLRIAADAAWVLVSDADRHRLVWLDWTRRRFIAQLGETDRAGNSPQQLASPTFVSVRGTRAVVADAGNQRILKLELVP